MTLNAVNMFGNTLDWNSTISLVLVVFGMALLLGAIITLIVLLIFAARRNKVYYEDVIYVEEDVDELNEPVVYQYYDDEDEPELLPEPDVVYEEVVPAEDEESYRAGRLTYNKSFMAKYIQSTDEIKDWYVHLKNELKSYKKVHDRMSWRRESFRFGKKIAARISIRGKTLCLYLPLDPADFVESKYRVEDVSDTAYYVDTPCMYRIRSDRRVKYASELIEMVMTGLGTKKTETPPNVDYYLPYEGIVELIEKDLIRRVIRNTPDEAESFVANG